MGMEEMGVAAWASVICAAIIYSKAQLPVREQGWFALATPPLTSRRRFLKYEPAHREREPCEKVYRLPVAHSGRSSTCHCCVLRTTACQSLVAGGWWAWAWAPLDKAKKGKKGGRGALDEISLASSSPGSSSLASGSSRGAWCNL
jgi:hypothetical protein